MPRWPAAAPTDLVGAMARLRGRLASHPAAVGAVRHVHATRATPAAPPPTLHQGASTLMAVQAPAAGPAPHALTRRHRPLATHVPVPQLDTLAPLPLMQQRHARRAATVLASAVEPVPHAVTSLTLQATSVCAMRAILAPQLLTVPQHAMCARSRSAALATVLPAPGQAR